MWLVDFMLRKVNYLSSPCAPHLTTQCAHCQRDFSVMNKTVLLAKENGVKVGAHPSLPDRQGFGRREMAIDSVNVILPSFIDASNPIS